MTDELLNRSAILLADIENNLEESRNDPYFTKRDAWREWQSAAYADPGFLYDGDIFDVYADCRNRDTDTLTMNEVRGCLTFLIRQTRCEYPPYSCLCDGTLPKLLFRFIDLAKEGSR